MCEKERQRQRQSLIERETETGCEPPAILEINMTCNEAFLGDKDHVNISISRIPNTVLRAALEQRGSNLNGLENFYLNAQARI